ncbi:hypothetical protein [Massilia sp. DD77]|uniref:hypothetical protein n=1 Tax=Massilia sp. DD77 TaxID=3109349 RepID=UPI0030008C89
MTFNPYWMFNPSLLGSNTQRIVTSWFSPTITFAGNAAIEERVVQDVASYGKQIGWLNEIVLALASGKPVPADTLASMIKAIEKIERIKDDLAQDNYDAAVEALDRLKKTNPEGYEALLLARAQQS